MGNLFPLGMLNRSCIRLSICKNRNFLRVVKMDGKVIEFKSPVLVKELLMDFEGFEVKPSKKSSNHLPPSFELQLGKIYYLVPSKSPINLAALKVEPEPNSAVKRIKVVITRKQLQEMLSKKTTSLEKIILGIDKACLVNSAANWKPNLISIPEENEFNSV